MERKKVLVVFGTRPEAIKMAPLIKALQEERAYFDTYVCSTGQHMTMLSQVLEKFDIKLDYNLSIMEHGQTLSSITTKVVEGMDKIMKDLSPNIVLVHGDTTTTFATGLAAFYNNVKIGHVEAGLRTHDIHSPFPEEFNRQVVGKLADIHFAPTLFAKENLLKENFDEATIHITGNTVVDVLNTTVEENYSDEVTKWAEGSKLILLTAHRRENQEKFFEIFTGINNLTKNNPDLKVFFPVHLNPKIKQLADEIFESNENVMLSEPVDVFVLHNIIAKSYIVITDSGGIQEEAASLGKPTLLLRDNTERPEGVLTGNITLIGSDSKVIFEEATKAIYTKEVYEKMSKMNYPFGSGDASKKITQIVKKRILDN